MAECSRIPVGLMKQTMSIAQAVVSDVSTPRERGQFHGFVGCRTEQDVTHSLIRLPIRIDYE